MRAREAGSRPGRPHTFPWATLTLPLVTTVVLWLATGNASLLLFALLGPVGMAATLIDTVRQTRRQARAEERATAELQLRQDRAEALQREGEAAEQRREMPSVADVLTVTDLPPPAATGNGDAILWRLGLDESARPVSVPALSRLTLIAPEGDERARQIEASFRTSRRWWGLPASTEFLSRATGRANLSISCTHVLTLHKDGWLMLTDRAKPVVARRLLPDLLTTEERHLAERRIEAQHLRTGGASSLPLGGLLPEVERKAGAPPAVVGVVGVTEWGIPVTFDLVADGPHFLLAGPTGSGKTEFLVSFVATVAAQAPVRRFQFVIIDFKGGGGFARLARLPHCRGITTDLDLSDVARAVMGLATEVESREMLLAAAGVTDIDDLPDVTRPARLAVIVDEFRALVDRVPVARNFVADVMARGRALGIHVVLATQRAVGTFGDDVAVNAAVRICLTPVGPDDAWHLLGERSLPRVPGRLAYVRRGDHSVEMFRPLLCDADILDRAVGQDRVVTDPLWWPALPSLKMSASGRLMWPDDASSPELGAIRGNTESPGVLVGLSALPTTAWQIERIDTRRGAGLLIVGGPGSGRSNLLEVMAAQASESVCRVTVEPTRAWDQLDALVRDIETGAATTGRLVLGDDVDDTLSRAPVEITDELLEMWSILLRQAPRSGWTVALTLRTASTARTPLARLATDMIVLGAASEPHEISHGRWPVGRGAFRGREFQACHLEVTSDHGNRPGGASLSVTRGLGGNPDHDGRLPTLDAVLATRVAIVVSGRPESWRARGYLAHSVDEWMVASAASRTRSAEASVVLDGLSRLQLRSLGVSADRVPPARGGTVVVLTPEGAFRRAKHPFDICGPD